MPHFRSKCCLPICCQKHNKDKVGEWTKNTCKLCGSRKQNSKLVSNQNFYLMFLTFLYKTHYWALDGMINIKAREKKKNPENKTVLKKQLQNIKIHWANHFPNPFG